MIREPSVRVMERVARALGKTLVLEDRQHDP